LPSRNSIGWSQTFDLTIYRGAGIVTYQALFDPTGNPASQRVADFTPPSGDSGQNVDYVYTDKIALAVNVALATGRPLLIRGKPGTGKSSLAVDVAQRLGWRYYAFVVTTRTEANDLLYRFDTVRRFNDANANALQETQNYITPAALWWALSPATARWRGVGEGEANKAVDPSELASEKAVVLIDEIDKADPDVPNNLLVAVGARKFDVPEIQTQITAEQAPLLVITTNDERSLPEAFLRRCVNLNLPEPDRNRMCMIAKAHFGEALNPGLLDAVLDKWEQLSAQAGESGLRPPGIAECLDLLWACKHLGISGNDDSRWLDISKATLWKHDDPPTGKGMPSDDDEL
jgi:MoxR-like ATPase